MPSILLALLFSVVAVAGSLYLSLGLGLRACPLCFYQRTFALALVGLLAVGLVGLRDQARRLAWLALPLALGGFGVAAFHTYLVVAGKLECPNGIADLGPAPAQSLAIYTLILATLIAGTVRDIRLNRNALAPTLLAVGLGVAAVVASLIANPPASPTTAPLQPGERLLTCRVPYRPASP